MPTGRLPSASTPRAAASGSRSGSTRGDRLRLGLRSAAGALPVLVSRCGGPALRDVADLLPVRTVPRADAAGSIVDLRQGGLHVAGGFAIGVRSTIRVRLGVLRRTDTDQGAAAPVDTGPARTLRTLSARYAITGVTGTLRAELSGVAGAECRALDSCGARGAVTVTPGDGETRTSRPSACGPARGSATCAGRCGSTRSVPTATGSASTAS